MVKYQIRPMGDQHIVVEFPNKISSRILQSVTALSNQLSEDFVQCMTGYNTVVVQYNPMDQSFEEAVQLIRQHARNAKRQHNTPSQTHYVDVVYNGPDLQRVAQFNKLQVEDVIRLHSDTPYRVYMLGFLPGFCYLGGMNRRLSTPRLDTPRQQIPAGSVGIAGLQTGVYPLNSPGGWNIIGTTDYPFFTQTDPPTPVQPGDRIIFRSVDSLGGK